jgi:hypothetical protein
MWGEMLRLSSAINGINCDNIIIFSSSLKQHGSVWLIKC